MASSFRRRRRQQDNTRGAGTINGLSGTKAWTGGITLTSVGLRDLDAILGGGQPLGTCMLLEEDRWTRTLAACLVKYWCAEGISQNQAVLIPTCLTEETLAPPDMTESDTISSSDGLGFGASTDDVRDLLQSLPRNLHWDKAQKDEDSFMMDMENNKPLEILEEEDEEEDGLDIAWQYRKSIQQERLGHYAGRTIPSSTEGDNNVYCHSYDLLGRMSEQRSGCLVEQCTTIVKCSYCSCSKTLCGNHRSCGFRLYQSWLTQLKEQFRTSSKHQVVRMLLHQVPIQTTNIALPLLLAYIRTHQLPVVVMVTVQSWKHHHGLLLESSLRRSCDVVLQTEGFASRVHYPPPPEFRHLNGLLLLPKVSTVTAATAHGVGGGHFADCTVAKRPPAHVYGMKRDRRKLHISLLHIPPEDYAGGGGSVGGGAVRSGAGRPAAKETSTTGGGGGGGGCGNGGRTSLLDF